MRWLALVWLTGCVWLCPRPAAACGWDWETFAAEAQRLPCINDVILGAFGTHTPEYYETTLQATQLALAWAPFYTEALDARAMALVHLGRPAEAKPVLEQRLRAAPEAYASHANLGTVLTFTGEYAQAIEHVDRALALEPRAHFGREKYHRALLVFLREEPASPAADFLGLTLSDEQRFAGSPARFDEVVAAQPERLQADVFDALAAMIAVYGAESLPALYFALGDVLALRGEIKLAWAAYRRAGELGHPAEALLDRYRARLLQLVGARSKPRRERHERDQLPGGYRGLDTYYVAARAQADRHRSAYHEWERAQLKRGLRPWVNADVERTYARMNQLRQRCKTPGLIHGQPSAAADGHGAP